MVKVLREKTEAGNHSENKTRRQWNRKHSKKNNNMRWENIKVIEILERENRINLSIKHL